MHYTHNISSLVETFAPVIPIMRNYKPIQDLNHSRKWQCLLYHTNLALAPWIAWEKPPISFRCVRSEHSPLKKTRSGGQRCEPVTSPFTFFFVISIFSECLSAKSSRYKKAFLCNIIFPCNLMGFPSLYHCVLVNHITNWLCLYEPRMTIGTDDLSQS